MFSPVSPTRRQFLTTGARALAGVTLGARVASAQRFARGFHPGMAVQTFQLPDDTASLRMTPHQWLVTSSSAEQFRSLALVAMDAAHGAGADFADIRIGVQRDFSVFSGRVAVGYGIRARVNGTWSFESGTVLTPDAVATAARTAVADARTAAAINARLGQPSGIELAPAPVVTGEWQSPVSIDPFAVPIDDYMRFWQSCAQVGDRFGAGVQTRSAMSWQLETRVFASTTGSLVTQQLTRGGIGLSASAVLPDRDDNVEVQIPGFGLQSVGFEAVLDPTIFDHLAVGAQEAIRWRELREQTFPDVGRYPVVFDGATMARIVGGTVNAALDGDRAAGLEADAAGETFLTPVSDVLRATTPQFSPLLTVTAGRAVPSRVAVQWDDDGVVPEAYTVVDRGHVTDYHTTRETAPLLAEWYAKHNHSLRSHGGCVSTTPASVPVGIAGDVSVAPAQTPADIDALMREMQRGFLVIDGYARVSPGLTGGLLDATLVIEVQQGKPIRRLRGMWFAFNTKGVVGKSLVALGSKDTVRTASIQIPKGIPWESVQFPVTAPAAFCKDVDVVHMALGA